MSAIAIVGMGARFAGAWDLVAYWDMMRAGRHAFGPVPANRWPAEAFLTDNRRATDKTYAPHGAFIQDIRSFPALALGLPPRRVEVMDPQQRMAIEVALQAIEDAGYRADELPRRTGVYVGITAQEYRSLGSARIAAMMMAAGAYGRAPADPSSIVEAVENLVPSRPYAAPGGLGNMAAAAVAQELDLHGPAYTTDAACASAHMAIYDAVHQLRSGAIDAALAGGSYAQITPDHYVVFARIGAMSASGYCRPFDHRADGFVQGDGAGLMLLKRLEDAVRDGDRIYGVIEGVAINNDGRGDGPMAPLQDGQTEVIDQAWEDAGMEKSMLGYHEAHGTGTPVGDPTELAGLTAAVGEYVKDRVPLGSAKANIGHTMSAAGIAGMIRATLAVHHGVIPPMAGYEAPNPKLDLEHRPFRVPTEAEAWTADHRVAACSAFGFGGTNGHILVRSWSGARTPSASVSTATNRAPQQDADAELVLLSAPTEDALRELCARTADAVAIHADATVAGVARAWARRRRQPARAGIVASTITELIDKLQAVAAGEVPRGVKLGVVAHDDAPKVAFLYPGQGAQRIGMLRDTRTRFPVVAETLDALEGALDGELTCPLTHLIYPELRGTSVDDAVAEEQLTATENCQPAMLAVGLALTSLLDAVGVRPSVVLGHSLGEFTAAAAGGALSATDAARFVAARGKAMAELDGDHGTMAAIMAPRDQVEGLLVDGAIIANVNHPRQLVVSGFSEAVGQVVDNANAAGIKAVPLQVSHGFHSPALEHLDSEPLLHGISLRTPDITVASGIAEHAYRDAEDARDVFLRHATSPVEFVRALEQCREAGANLYLQVGAGGPLAAFARGSLPRDHRGILTLAGKQDDDGGRTVLETLAQLWTLGVDIDVTAITAAEPLPSLPPSVLPREDYWLIKDEVQLPIEVDGFVPKPRPAAPKPQAEQVNAPAVEEKASEDTVQDKVIGIIAKVSAYPRSSLRLEMTLVDDLGFDSLMVGDLATGLSEAFPSIDGIPQELLINRPTVSDMVEFARTAGQGPAVSYDDDAALTAYAVRWTPAELPALPGRELPAGHRVLVVGDESVAAAFASTGARVNRISAADAASAGACDLLVWSALDALPQPQSVLGDGVDVPDRVTPFIAALAAQAKAGATPDVIVLSDADDAWAAGLHGVVRGLTREWPGCSATSLHLDASVHSGAGALALAQWTSADRTADVRHDGTGRQIAAFIAQDPDAKPAWTPGSEDVVLITGGTRGIGLQLGERLLAAGASVVLVGRSAPGAEAQAVLDANPGRAVAVQADASDRDGLAAALAGRGITAVVHAAGVLADGALEEVDPARGQLARSVKVEGALNAVHAAASSNGGTLPAVVLGIGSWAGRFGNRHQAWYGAANAELASVLASLGTRGVTAEFGPWTGSEMVQSIPAPVQSAMRAEGIDFVGPEAGMQALLQSLASGEGAWTFGRDLPATARAVETRITLSTETHPYLLDHAIEGTPILPLAGATDLLAWGAGAEAPFAVTDVRLFQGVAVTEPVELILATRGDRAELRFADRGALAYRARVKPLDPSTLEDPGAFSGGEPGELSLDDFYGITFHGPLLAGLTAVDGVGSDFARGRVRIGSPAEWIPATSRARFAVDPLVLDSAMQLSAYVAWNRYRRAGTPVALGRYVQLADFPDSGELIAEVAFGPIEGDRFTGTLRLRHPDTGALLAVAEDVVAELRQAEQDDEDDAPFEIKPEWIDFSKDKAVVDLEMRLAMAQLGGIENPYFRVQEGTARDTTVMGGKEYINYSSYNYIGLSGDPRVLDKVKEAVDRYGTSVSASRVASGERPFHGALEKGLAECQRKPDSLVFTAGHATNVTTIGHLFGPDDLIIHDEYIHDSGLQGIKLSGAARRGFKHDDPASCEHELKRLRRHYKRVLILLEGVYSMDGDICQLPAYVALKRKYGCLLMVDEAHSFGIIGENGYGCAEHFDLAPDDVDIWMGTLSKSLASCGGWIAADEKLVNYLRYTAPGFIYSAGLTAANGVAALESLELMKQEPWRVKKLQDNARFFQKALVDRGIDPGPAKGESGVVPAVTGNSMWALQLSQRLNHAGVNVQPIVYPAVPDDAARLRFFLSSTHSHEQLAHTATLVADILGQVKKDFPLP